MADREWKLGKDMFLNDCILDPITFYDVALAVKCNCKVIDIDAVLNTFKEIFEQRLEDTQFLLTNNAEEIANEALKMKGK